MSCFPPPCGLDPAGRRLLGLKLRDLRNLRNYFSRWDGPPLGLLLRIPFQGRTLLLLRVVHDSKQLRVGEARPVDMLTRRDGKMQPQP